MMGGASFLDVRLPQRGLADTGVPASKLSVIVEPPLRETLDIDSSRQTMMHRIS